MTSRRSDILLKSTHLLHLHSRPAPRNVAILATTLRTLYSHRPELEGRAEAGGNLEGSDVDNADIALHNSIHLSS